MSNRQQDYIDVAEPQRRPLRDAFAAFWHVLLGRTCIYGVHFTSQVNMRTKAQARGMIRYCIFDEGIVTRFEDETIHELAYGTRDKPRPACKKPKRTRGHIA